MKAGNQHNVKTEPLPLQTVITISLKGSLYKLNKQTGFCVLTQMEKNVI